MRIIAGEMRGRRLKTVAGWQTRPTADKVKGAIFSVLQDKLPGALVLDLFAGTGNLALEALSRGAKSAVLVETDPAAQKVIRENILLSQLKNKIKFYPMDAFAYLAQDGENVFDLIFIDPPYRKDLAARALGKLVEPCRLSPYGVIVTETARDEVLVTNSTFEVRKTGEYGDTKIWYLQRADV
ncbi:MAG: 16S rRNA (guanine(966)-N(2))-methyltransferase RsmD [Desulfitobacteriaceae bacterium]